MRRASSCNSCNSCKTWSLDFLLQDMSRCQCGRDHDASDLFSLRVHLVLVCNSVLVGPMTCFALHHGCSAGTWTANVVSWRCSWYILGSSSSVALLFHADILRGKDHHGPCIRSHSGGRYLSSVRTGKTSSLRWGVREHERHTKVPTEYTSKVH